MSQPITIDDKIAQLEALVAWFEGDDFSLDQAADRYAQARALAAEINAALDATENTITMMANDDSTEPA